MPIENVVGWKKGDIIKAENKEIYKIAITDETTNSRYNTTWYPVHLDIIIENVYDILGYDMLYNNKHVKIVASTDRELNVLSIDRSWIENYIKSDFKPKTIFLETEIDIDCVPEGYYRDEGHHLGDPVVLRKIHDSKPDKEFTYKLKIKSRMVHIIPLEQEINKILELNNYYSI